MPLKTDFKNDVFSGNRKYNVVDNPDGTKSFVDVTEYEETGDNFGAKEVNETHSAVNKKALRIIENPSPVKPGDAVAGNLLAYIKANSQWEAAEYGMPYDGTNIILRDGYEGNFDSGEVGYRLYRQSDGTMSTAVREKSYYIGWIESTTKAWIGMLGGVDKNYLVDLQFFYAMPRLASQIGLKFEFDNVDPPDGVMIRRKSSAWEAGDDETTGILIATLTDDTDYKDENEWLIDDDSLSVSTEYFYKAFPYKGTMYNTQTGHNEVSCTTRDGELELTGDNVIGSTIYDDFKSNDGAASNITFQSFAVGNGMVFNGSSSKISLPSGWRPGTTSWHLRFKTSSLANKLVIYGEGSESGGYRKGFEFGINTSGNAYIITANNVLGGGVVTKTVSLGLTVDTEYELGFVYNQSAATFAVYLNGSYVGTATSCGAADTSTQSHRAIGYTVIAYYTYSGPMELDQIRVFEGDIGSNGFTQLHNDGVAA